MASVRMLFACHKHEAGIGAKLGLTCNSKLQAANFDESRQLSEQLSKQLSAGRWCLSPALRAQVISVDKHGSTNPTNDQHVYLSHILLRGDVCLNQEFCCEAQLIQSILQVA